MGAQITVVIAVGGVRSTSNTDGTDLAVFSPDGQGGSRDAISLNNVFWSDVFLGRRSQVVCFFLKKKLFFYFFLYFILIFFLKKIKLNK